MTTLVICRGLPGSGKTTKAREWVATNPRMRARVNRDDLRAMLHDGVYIGDATERQVRMAEDQLVADLLANLVSVVCDDTNLDDRRVAELRKIADDQGAVTVIYDLRHVPVRSCVARDAIRAKPVGEAVIAQMASQWKIVAA